MMDDQDRFIEMWKIEGIPMPDIKKT